MTDVMRHPSDDDLALLAVGETPAAATAAHLQRCHTCAAELAALRTVVTIARSGRDDISTPPPRVWHTIEAAISGQSNVTPLPRSTSRRRRSPQAWTRLLVAASVGAVLGGGAVAAVNALSHTPTVVASTTLEPLPDSPVAAPPGTAKVQSTASGDVLAVATPQLPSPSGYYEVWLLDPTSGGMIAMGVVPAGSEAVDLPVPPGVDLTTYNAVDISDEPMDGNPGHSSVSVLRGTLQT